MIETNRAKIPWRWVMLMVMGFYVQKMSNMASNGLMPFTIRKFTADPALIQFLGSIDVILGTIIGPLVLWKCDRIWTPMGRRKPFMMAAWFGSALFIACLPFANSLATLILFLVAFNLFADLNVYEPLYMEVVPLKQRGRGGSMRQAVIVLAELFVAMMLLKNWDSVTAFHVGGKKFLITGEAVAYWTIAAIIFFTALLIILSVREIKPKKIEGYGERFSFRSLFGSMFLDRQLLKIYALMLGTITLQMGLASLSPLLLTEQFGYSKSSLADMYTALRLINLCLVIPITLPLAGYLADHFDRLKLFIVGLSLSTLHPLAYWSYIHFVAPDQIPSLRIIIAFSLGDGIVDTVAVVAMVPLVFDYVPKNRMGTLAAGMALVKGGMRLILMNLVGLFVKYYSKFFCAPGVVDYSSGYLLIFAASCAGLLGTLYFLRERAAGRVIPYGRLEHEAALNAEKEKKAEEDLQSIVG